MKLEQEALAREESTEHLSEREQHFVNLVAFGGDPSTAARTVGYKDPFKAAARLLTYTKIASAITAAAEAKAIRDQAAAKRLAPIVVDIPTVHADVARSAGSFDRTTWSAELLDEQALIEAVIRGGAGIPRDILQVNPAKLNEYARSLHELIDRWPGVRSVKKTTTV